MQHIKVGLFLFLVILSHSVKSQTSASIIPLNNFLQKNADTSFVYERYDNWISSAPKYLFLIKKQDTLAAFVYDSNYKKDDRINSLPKVFRDTILRKNREIKIMTPIGVNHLFVPKYMNKDSLHAFWRDLVGLGLWNITDDRIDGIGCAVNKDKNGVLESDQTGIRVYLITKAQVKMLEFYAPRQLEEICPGRKGRQIILKAEKVFLSYLKD